MLLYLEQRILSLNFSVLLEIIPNRFQRMLTLLYVKNEVKNFAKALHNFVIKNAIYWKLWPVEC